jgi:Ca2+-binding RTX toxin-like protein
MAYNATGTVGNDTLNQSGEAGPGTIVGLAGNDSILSGTGLVTVDAGAGADTVLLQTGNTGAVTGGTDNDSISNDSNDISSMTLFGNEGADTIRVLTAFGQTILGGNDSNDAADSILSSSGADLIFGNGGEDTINGGGDNDTIIGGFNNDLLIDFGGNNFVFANEGNDTLDLRQGDQTVFAGQGNDSVSFPVLGHLFVFLNEGADTIFAINEQGATIAGGNDSADGSDSILAGPANDVLYGNGGNDTISAGDGNDVLIGGFGADLLRAGGGADLVFANESDDTVIGGATVFGGLGNDTILAGNGDELLFGNEGNDTIRGDGVGAIGIDTIAGGGGADWFNYTDQNNDGNNVASGGPIERITDVNFDEDRFLLTQTIDFAAFTNAGGAGTLDGAADNAIAAARGLNGGVGRVAAGFAFNGRTYLAVDNGGDGQFSDTVELLVDITGAVGTIDAGDFVT